MIKIRGGKGGELTILEPGANIGKGRPIGSKNKAKLASEVIELYFKSVFSNHPKIKDFIKEFPNVTKLATIEEIIYLVQCSKAIFKEDTNAAHFIINRARGTKPIDQTAENNTLNLPSEEITNILKEHLKNKF